MNRDRISEILAAYRPGEGLEDDPEVREALALAEKDAALGEALRQSLAFDEAFSGKLREAPVPENLYGLILAKSRNHTKQLSENPGRPRENKILRFFHPAAFAAAAAIILLLALSFTFWNPPSPAGSAAPELQTASVASLLESANALYGRLNPSFVSRDGEEIVNFLKSRNGHIPSSIPGNVSWGHAFACDVMEVDGKTVSVVCFLGEEDTQTFHLFTFKRKDFERMDIPSNPRITSGNGPCSATWTHGQLIHVLYSNGGEKNLRQLLDI